MIGIPEKPPFICIREFNPLMYYIMWIRFFNDMRTLSREDRRILKVLVEAYHFSARDENGLREIILTNTIKRSLWSKSKPEPIHIYIQDDKSEIMIEIDGVTKIYTKGTAVTKAWYTLIHHVLF